MDRLLLIAGRVLLSVIFILSGISKITGWSGTEGMLVSKGVPLAPVALAVVILVEIVGGLMVLSGFHAKWAAIVLFLYLIPTTLMFHAFWGLPSDQQQNMMAHFLKNVSIMGGLLVTASVSRK
jgi:putative oxidoreductase